jgi:hypothetical protein
MPEKPNRQTAGCNAIKMLIPNWLLLVWASIIGGTSWAQVDTWCVRARVRRRRSWPGLGFRVSLRVKRLVGAGVAFGIHHATRLPTATAITAAPNRGALFTWRNGHSRRHRRGDAIRRRPVLRKRRRWPRDDHQLRRHNHRGHSLAVLRRSDHRGRICQVRGLHGNRCRHGNYGCRAKHERTHDSLCSFLPRSKTCPGRDPRCHVHLEPPRLAAASSPRNKLLTLVNRCG